MKKQLIAIIFLGMLLVSLSFISATTITNVAFNGNFKNGTTLYSGWYHVVSSTLYVRDAYPIKENCTSTQVCSKYNYIYEKTCLSYYDDSCKKYDYHYERQCVHYASYDPDKCLSWKKVKIQDGCIKYRDDLCRRYRTTKTKGDCIAFKTKTVCDVLPIGCLDPTTGVYTNQLSLKNFKMSYDGVTWLSIPYGMNQQWVQDANIRFKVDIPNVCNPTYDINKAIFIVG